MRRVRNLRLSVRALAAHRVRTTLAIAGAAIGSAGVVILTAIGEGARGAVLSRIEQLGPNVLVVMADPPEARAGRRRVGEVSVRELRVADAAAIVRGAASIVRAAPARDGDMLAKFGPTSTPVTVLGTTHEWFAIRRVSLERGRLFTEGEDAQSARVAVLGARTRSNLFPDSVNPIGRNIYMGRTGHVPFEVVGVLASKGLSVTGATSEDDRIVVPLQTAMRRLFNVDDVNLIFLEASADSPITAAEREAAAILRARTDASARRDGFIIQNQRALLDVELATQTSFRRLIMALGFLSLALGGVGILSMMLLSVRERRSEIGLRVALGARRRDIVAQFLAESLILAAAGGVIGIVLGAGAAAIVSATTSWNARVTEATLFIAIVSAAVIGAAAGVLPASRAAAVDPDDALQSR